MSVFGSKFQLDVGEYIQRNIFLGSYEPQETRVIGGFLKPGMTFLDVGANVGYFSALAAKLVGATGRVVAVEPSPVAFARLSSMVRSNALTNVGCFNIGLSDAPGQLKLHLLKGSRNHTPSFVVQDDSANAMFARVDVPVQKLDDLVAQLQISAIDLMKIDVEGWEPRVFAGATQLLKERRIRAIVTEINEYWLQQVGSSREIYMNLLFSFGFRDVTESSPMQRSDNRLLILS